ncbi:MAG: helix-turn-helix transcriptional regulator [Ruminococcus sp.]|nr:helix-turn-helix transcriptional regulator [Ruminococcus sp.]
MSIDYKEIGQRIAKRRKELGFKQYQVCEMIDVNYKYISNLETGRSAPSLELIMNLSDALRTTPDYFLVGTEKRRSIDKNMTDKICNLSQENKILLDGIIDVMLDKQK